MRFKLYLAFTCTVLFLVDFRSANSRKALFPAINQTYTHQLCFWSMVNGCQRLFPFLPTKWMIAQYILQVELVCVRLFELTNFHMIKNIWYMFLLKWFAAGQNSKLEHVSVFLDVGICTMAILCYFCTLFVWESQLPPWTGTGWSIEYQREYQTEPVVYAMVYGIFME